MGEFSVRLVSEDPGLPVSGDQPLALFVSASGYQSKQISVPHPSGRVLVELAPVQGAALSGLVLDATGGPVPGADVTARDASSGAEVANAITGSDGHFHLTVPERKMELTVSLQGYSTAQVRADVPVRDLTIVLVPACAAAGRVVTKAEHLPVGRVRVTAFHHLGATDAVESLPSDADGRFTFEAIVPGEFDFVVSSSGWRSEPRAGRIEPGCASNPIELEVVPAAALEMQVDVAGVPCPAGHVELKGPMSAAVDLALGAGRLGSVLPGRYEVVVSCDTGAPRHEVLEVGPVDARYSWSLEPGLTLRGTAWRASGAPLAGASVLVQLSHAPAGQALQKTCLSDSQGRFLCAGLVPGEYEVGLSLRGNRPLQLVVVSANELDATNVTLVSPATGTLRATIEGSDVLPAELTVSASHERLQWWFAGRRTGRTFVFEDAPLGTYRIYTSQSFDEKYARAASLVRDGEIVDVLVPAVSANQGIAGIVVDDGGLPIVDAWVHATSMGLHYGIPSESSRVAMTDGSGEFALSRLSPGAYALTVRTSSGTLAERKNVASGTTGLVIQLADTLTAARDGED
jgi:hypothetical protein